jgi:hypothetical protein
VIGLPLFHAQLAALGASLVSDADGTAASTPAQAPAPGRATPRVVLFEHAPADDAVSLAALAHAAPALIYACTPDGLTAYINREWLDYTGSSDVRALAERWQDLVHPDDHAQLLAQREQAQASHPDDLRETQLRLRHAGGEFRWHRSRARLVRDAQGQPRLWVGVATDIEHEKRTEEALRRREREFLTLVDNAPDGITRLDRELRHVYANHAIHSAFGVPAGQLIGRTAPQAGVPAAVAEAWRDAAQRAMRDGQEQECEFSAAIEPGGEEHHFLCRLVPESEHGERIDSVLCVAYDITHRRRALLALRDSEQRFHQFAQSSDDVFWFADLTRDELLYVSPAFERLWGLSGTALQADPSAWLRPMLADDRARLPSPFYGSAAGADGHEPVREYRLRRPDGQVLWIRDRRFHLQVDGDRVLRIGGIAEDITERKLRDLEREELLARERAARNEAEALASAKDEFLAVVSHELRSPLNAIRGWAHVLRKTLTLTPAQQRPLDAIDRNVTAQARMVDDLLDTQRLLRGKVTLERRLLPLPSLVDLAIEALRPAAVDKQLRLQVEHASDVGMIDVDPERLRQALVNLLSNAVKFTPAQGQVRVRTARHGADRIAIEIADTGVGLEPAQASRVFEPFRQMDGSSSTRRQGGLGLGLALARQIVELHGGRLSAHSDGPDRGATFTIELPALPAGSSELASSAPAALATAPLAGRRVAVVEDDPEGRQILELLLRDEGIDGQFFSNADEAFRYLRGVAPARRPEVLISDLAMPGEDGYSLIRRLRALHSERGEEPLPAVALTAFASAGDRARALAAGFDAHLGKPMDPDQLRAALTQLLQSREAAASTG